jgi:hypothetical protein
MAEKELDSFGTENVVTKFKITCNATAFNCIVAPFTQKYSMVQKIITTILFLKPPTHIVGNYV